MAPQLVEYRDYERRRILGGDPNETVIVRIRGAVSAIRNTANNQQWSFILGADLGHRRSLHLDTVGIEASPQFLSLGGVTNECIPSNNCPFANFWIPDVWPSICPYELD